MTILARLAACLAVLPFGAASAPPPAEHFARLPAMDLVRLSPNGDLLAWALNSPQGTEITMHSVKQGGTIKRFSPGSEQGVKLRDMEWADDETLLVTISVTRQYPGLGTSQKTYEFFRTMAVDTGSGASRVMLRGDGDQRNFTSSAHVLLLDNGKPGTIVMSGENFLQSLYRDETNTRLSGDRANSGVVLSLFEVDTRTGHGKLLEGGRPFTLDWIVDRKGNGVALSEWRPETREFVIKSREGGGWKTIFKADDWADLQPAALAPDGQAIVALGARGGGQERAWRVPLDGSDITAMTPDDVIVQGALIDRFTATVEGISLGGLEPTVQWFDPRQQRIQASISKAFAGRRVTIFDQSRDRSRALIGAESADSPRVYYLVDLSKGTADIVGDSYPELEKVALGEQESLKYAARDGLEIPAYLTLPPDREPKDLPLIVFPHGGPWSRDDPGFDWWAQFLATRGYAVFQPQFRGSVGFGEELRRAGTRAWGQAMQEDLLDGVDMLVKKGWVDASRVCIVGASYGGYAALAGVALAPDRFACAVSVNGVSDLGNMFGYLRSRYGDESDTLHAWKELVGVPYDGAFEEFSPARLVPRIEAPILLLHGRDDVVVPYAQSQSFARALASLGKPHEFVTLDGEDHWLTGAPSRLAVLQAIEAFLATHLTAAAP